MQTSFEYYVALVDHWPFEVGVDMSLPEDSRMEGLKYRLHVRFELNHPTEDGLCTAEEEALLCACQQEITADLEEANHRLVATVTHRSARTLVIYSREEPNEAHRIVQSLERVTTHKTTVIHEIDAEWQEFREVLYPSLNFRHQIKDRQLLREFERRGDDCSEVHSIEPCFAAASKESADGIAELLGEKGFKVLGVDEANGVGWRVKAQVNSPLGLAILDDLRRIWLHLAESHNAQYEGWSADLIPVSGENNNTGIGGHLFGDIGEDYN